MNEVSFELHLRLYGPKKGFLDSTWAPRRSNG